MLPHQHQHHHHQHRSSQPPPQGTRPHLGHPDYGLPPARSPQSPHFRDHRHGSRDYFGIDERRDPYYPPSIHSSSSSSQRYRSESYEAGRSTSLTNAATPFRSGFDSLRGATDPANSQRSRSLSSGAQLYPYSSNGHPGSSASSSAAGYTPKGGATPMPYFMRAFSEDSTSDDHDPYRGYIGHPGLPEGLIAGSSFSKRKYSCTYPGCNKRFTTSGHLARHNRIHTGERNFSCLMPGCPSKFSRQDNMMQHYRTHISPKSRRGVSKKQDQQDAESPSEINESDAVEYPTTPQQGHSPSALPPTGLSRQGSRHSSPPRLYPSDHHNQPEDMDHDDDSRPSSRQTHQFSPPSHGSAGEHQRSNTWSVPASPTSPMTQGGDRMEDAQSSTSSSSASSSSTRDQQLFYYRQQQQYQQQYQHQYQQRQLQKQQQQQAASHASAYYHAAQSHVSHGHHHGHSSHGHHGVSRHLASPSSSSASSSEMHPHAYSYAHSQAASSERSGHASGRASHGNHTLAMNMTPPSPQSTPATPTKYRFDPIQDCLQQERRQREEATL
ncbi:unnamed protein product [Mortierella alpina]